MTERIEILYNQLKSKKYRENRVSVNLELKSEWQFCNHAENFKKISAVERPILLNGDRMGFNRTTNIVIPGIGNLTPDYSRVLTIGYDKLADEIRESMEKTDDAEKLSFGKAMLDCMEVVFEIADKYKDHAKDEGNIELYNALLKIPHNPAESFYEACVFMKLSIYAMRLAHTIHLTLGRFDQYMYPFYIMDKNRGVTDEEIFEIIEEFFISINFDGDLYPGVQLGDNGQSMVLGGFDKDGNYLFNELSRMCMDASLELNLIDPKINLRVGKNTPDEIYELGTELTKKGLGFPQYCNDDVVVEGLKKLGYDDFDAINYTVAACWEYIVQGNGGDIPNIEVMDFPYIVNNAIRENLMTSDTFEELMKSVEVAIKKECDRIIDYWWDFNERPAVLCSIYTDGPTKTLKDVLHGGAKYSNYGCHGAGISNATDALSAIKKTIYEDESVSKEELLEAMEKNFEGYQAIRNKLLSADKMGNNIEAVNLIADKITDAFSKNINNRDNGHNGIWRAGTGSAMEYILKGKKCPATADGRKNGEPYSSSYSPSIGVRTDGILSVIQSFTNYDMTEIVNGGPLTLELHDTVFKNDIGTKKVAQLVKEFIKLGGHQLQLNSINGESLKDAQKNPENYPNLIVRVWGWSGYFNELDIEYQNHIINRVEYTM